eukprot:CAMPEP_0114597006 /NCGR_PEP_ID=MMETSP0125-20121206/19231_1 /TAXON_ID=485358 ORGANISM="Aristerostoma sp., Strain ATCC 50986" /NCGR_SAMPLE_ID=MMETSP0125 /ASSEMBLY_ACC=CAM_ASM_000245 /LENGTH=51 /DNA_ID=CAMNT_0001801015 /DNA_START=232 /DNA_END=387 /DNA_ORIENTATION=+
MKAFIKEPFDQVEGSEDGKGKENGNGSIMRLAPIPIAFINDLDGCLEYARK